MAKMIALRIRSYERSRRIQYLQEQIAYLGELPPTQSVLDRRNQFLGELEVIKQVDKEDIDDLEDM